MTIADQTSDQAEHDATEPLLRPVFVRVLDGIHAEAQLQLEPGRYLLGSGQACDLRLRDDGIDEEHLLLTLTDRRMQLRVLGTPIRLNGERVATNDLRLIHPDSILNIGSVRLAIGTDLTDWRALGNAATVEPSPTNGSATEPLALARLSLQLREFAVRHRRVSIGAAMALGLLVTGLTVSAVSSTRQLAADDAIDKRVKSIASETARLGMPEVRVRAGPDGRALVSGYVADYSALRKLQQALAPYGADTALAVYSADELVRFSGELLRTRGVPAQVEYVGNGVLSIKGQDNASGMLENTAKGIVREIAGVVAVRTDVTPHPVALAKSPDPAPADPYVLGGVSGVNAGHSVPYISSGNNYIFSGGALKNGMTVVAIEPERVIVDDRGKKRASEIQVP